MGGALKIQAETAIISQSSFINNSNLKGGAIYFNKNENFQTQFFHIEYCIFEKNEAGDNGGGIEFEKTMRLIKGNITNSFFIHNLAWCKYFKIDFLSI